MVSKRNTIKIQFGQEHLLCRNVSYVFIKAMTSGTALICITITVVI